MLSQSHKDRYCIEICKAKCCYTKVGPCPNLTKEFKCGIYNKWKNNTCGYHAGKGYTTAPIEYVVEHKLLPASILNQCVYAHPELVEKLNGN